MLRPYIRWKEERLARRMDPHKRVEPMSFGLEFLGLEAPAAQRLQTLLRYAQRNISDSHRFFAASPAAACEFSGEVLTFPSAITTDCPRNNTVMCRVFEATARKHAALIIPHWNGSAAQYDGFAGRLRRSGITALTMSLPYHDRRRAGSGAVANGMISSNLGRTIQSCRQAVLDARLAIDWLEARGYQTITVCGVSLGSSIASIVAAHDDRVDRLALLLVASRFGEVVWSGRATGHIRLALEGRIALEQLDKIWSLLSPITYICQLQQRGIPVLAISADQDQVFPRHLVDEIIDAYRSHGVQHYGQTLPCGHYTALTFPFNRLAFASLARFVCQPPAPLQTHPPARGRQEHYARDAA